ncbi:aldo/keto reductase [Streptomyces sp. NBC_01102]|uniref:aldo/keto reductase n=1 Tax=Streptomyces sp. NBC_01102 TaxID=2903749 RepID=UPI0038635D88|nr:aldo/keto reductase [Streptomyces sp. NBC_01102]
MTLGSHESEPDAVRWTSGRVLDACLEAGGNFVDTADIYGGGSSEPAPGGLAGGPATSSAPPQRHSRRTTWPAWR